MNNYSNKKEVDYQVNRNQLNQFNKIQNQQLEKNKKLKNMMNQKLIKE